MMTDNYNLFVVMDALLADSPTVPGLLTEYILKGECKAAGVIYLYVPLAQTCVIYRGWKKHLSSRLTIYANIVIILLQHIARH